jgi:hypothetical protein
MALAYDVRGNVVQAIIIGSTRLSELRALLDVAVADPRVTTPLRVFLDASDASFSDTLEEACLSVDRLASRHRLADSRCAIVVQEPLRRLLSWTLVFYARRHGIDVRLFAEAHQAHGWLANPAAFPLRSPAAAWRTLPSAAAPRATTTTNGT